MAKKNRSYARERTETLVRAYQMIPDTPHRNSSNIMSEIVALNSRYVMMFVNKIAPTQRHIHGDLYQEGLIGLIEAARKWDREKSSFHGYAAWWIRKCILGSIGIYTRPIRLPRYKFDRNRAIRREAAEAAKKHNRLLTTMELSELLKMDPRQIDDALTANDQCVPIEEVASYRETRDAAESADTTIDANRVVIDIHNALNILDSRDRLVIEKRYGINCDYESTLSEIAAEVGLTVEGTRQVTFRVMRTLRQSGRIRH